MNKDLVKSTSLFFYILLLIVCGAALVVVYPYLTTILLAVLTVIIFRGPYYYIYNHVGKKAGWATLFSIILVFLTLIIPLLILISLIVNQSLTFVEDLQMFLATDTTTVESVTASLNGFIATLPFPVPTLSESQILTNIRNVIQPVGTFAFSNLARLGGTTLSFVTSLIIYIMLLTSLFPNQKELKEFFLKISPFDRETNLLYLRRILAMSESMLVGTIIVAFIQGAFAAGTLAIAGVPYIFFWFMLFVFFSIVPLGGGFILIPIGVVLILMGHTWQGVFVILSQALFITNIDNIIRPRIVAKEAAMEPSLLLIGVLGGVSIFGFFGVIYGPVILIFLQTTIEIYMKYYHVQARKTLKDD